MPNGKSHVKCPYSRRPAPRIPPWCTLHVGLIYGPFCPNVLFLFSPKSTIFMPGNLKEYFFALIYVPHAVNGANIWQKKVKFWGPFPKKPCTIWKTKRALYMKYQKRGICGKMAFKESGYLVFKGTFVELDMRALIERVCWWKYKFWWARWRRVRALQTLKFTRFAARFSETPSRYCLCTQGPNQTPRTCLGIPHTSKCCCMSKNIPKVPPKWDADCTQFMNFTILVAWFSKISSRYGMY